MTSTQLKPEESKPTAFGPPIRPFEFEANIFSQPWNDSDIVLVVEDKEFHVHRSILSFQSVVFKAMFNGNFKDATQDKIKLEDDNYEAMLQFLQLLYPANTLRDYAKVNINDGNILQIIEVADKYGAINIIKQCMDETVRLNKPENAMRLLPYAVRHELPREEIFDVMNRHVSTEQLKNFAPELDNGSVYTEMLKTKSRFMENYATRANTMMESLVDSAIHQARSKAGTRGKEIDFCPEHDTGSYAPFTGLSGNFRDKRKCENCLKAYKSVIVKYVIFSFGSSEDLIDLLKISNDIATSLRS